MRKIKKRIENIKIKEVEKRLDYFYVVVGLVIFFILVWDAWEWGSAFINAFFAAIGFLPYLEQCREAIWPVLHWMLLADVLLMGIHKIIFRVIYFMKSKKNTEYWEMPGMSKFCKVIHSYLLNKDATKCLVITGEWGKGKTYCLNKFLERFNAYRKKCICRISCFGLESREQIKDIIMQEARNQDDTITKYVVGILEKIPLLGEIIAVIHTKKYEPDKLPPNVILIFEDFERITLLKNEAGREKINIAVGYINELIERYHRKVIIVCNRKEIGEDIFNELLYRKLESRILEAPNGAQTYELVEKELMSSSLSREEMQGILCVIEKECVCMDAIIRMAGLESKRVTCHAISNFKEYYRIRENHVNQEAVLYSYFIDEICRDLRMDILTEDSGGRFYDFYEQYIMDKDPAEWRKAEFLLAVPANMLWVGKSFLRAYTENQNGGSLDLQKEVLTDTESQTLRDKWNTLLKEESKETEQYSFTMLLEGLIYANAMQRSRLKESILLMLENVNSEEADCGWLEAFVTKGRLLPIAIQEKVYTSVSEAIEKCIGLVAYETEAQEIIANYNEMKADIEQYRLEEE